MKLSVLLFISQSLAAPAIVTIFETVTENSPSPTLAAQSSVAIQQSVPTQPTPATEAQTQATSTSTGGWLSRLLSELESSSSSSSTDSNSGSSLWDALFGTSSSSSSIPATSSGSGSSSNSFIDFLNNFFGSQSSASVSPAATTPISTSPIFTSQTGIPTSLATSTSSYQPTTVSTSTSSSSTSATSSDNDIYAAIDQIPGIDKSFATSILDAHNQYRSQHQAGDLSWDIDTYNYAKNNADNYDCSGILTHTHGQYGENLAAGFKDGPSVVQAWVDEPYDYSTADTYNHFTQVVWKGSKRVGCAYKDCRSNGWGLYVVCEYDPAGNIIGQERENVLPSN
ncbi:unnamed protein product [Candida verbasci]|uniref:SCP domain-containing protein n=1 Tax=Candida verbasci TaxID=1227364 RepID=A0A9W4XFE6_9ASCO|nr:unnamed protein product [Candida verbasci]